MTTALERSRRPRIGPAGRAALEVLACCPRMPTDVLGVMLGHHHTVTTAQLLSRLRRASLIQYQEVTLGPLLGPRPVRLWTLAAEGRVLVATRGPVPRPEASTQMQYGDLERQHDPARQRGIPLLVACYRLLAEVASGLDRPVRVCAWEHPWIRTFASTDGARRRRVRLPAGAVLQSRRSTERQSLRLLLLPDIGTAPLSSYRPALQALVELRRTALDSEVDEPLLVVGVATAPPVEAARVRSWRALLQNVAARADDHPLRALVLGSAPEVKTRKDDIRRPNQVDEIFAMVACHPLLTRRQLASLLRTSTRRIARLEAALMDRGWLRPVISDDLPPGNTSPIHDQVQRLGLIDLTAAGQREAARRLLVPAGLARRRHGITVSDASRRRFLRHLQHTLGANAFFVDLAAASMQANRRGGSDTLVEWRSAAACARGRFRPDGYGCYRRGPWRFGFFLEYDRGTERSSHYAAKLATYYRYRDSGSYKRDYQSFPTLLVVTTSELAEARIAHEALLAQQRYGGTPLSIFLTTTARILANPSGVLGAIWRGPGKNAQVDALTRVAWLPGRRARACGQFSG